MGRDHLMRPVAMAGALILGSSFLLGHADPKQEMEKTTQLASLSPVLTAASSSSATADTNSLKATDNPVSEAGALPEKIELSDPISEAAAVYGAFHSDVATYRDKMETAQDLEDALTALGGQNSDQLVRGWLSYSALVAAQAPEFADSVKETDAYFGRDEMLRRLNDEGYRSYWRTLKNGETGINLAVRAADADAQRLRSAGAQVKEQSYSLQKLNWANKRISNSSALAEKVAAAALSQRPIDDDFLSLFESPEVGDVLVQAGKSGAPSLWDNVSDVSSKIQFPSVALPIRFSSPAAPQVNPNSESTANHIATLATYKVLGESANQSKAVTAAMMDWSAKDCIYMAQLQLQGCVAASYKNYEPPFCTGEYLKEIAACIDSLGQ